MLVIVSILISVTNNITKDEPYFITFKLHHRSTYLLD